LQISKLTKYVYSFHKFQGILYAYAMQVD